MEQKGEWSLMLKECYVHTKIRINKKILILDFPQLLKGKNAYTGLMIQHIYR